MISYTTRYINIVSLIITIIISFFFSNIKLNQFEFNKISISNLIKKDTVYVEMKTDNIKQETEENKEETEEKILKSQNNYSYDNTKEENWKIIIPSINLEAHISEGTSQQTMSKFVGHFSETATKSGNIGLAAHNRGYEVNYFSEIKNLKTGDKIIYKYNDFEKTYIVSKNKIIKDTDWSYLENTNDNRITLITCVENESDYRRCIQGIEEKEADKNKEDNI